MRVCCCCTAVGVLRVGLDWGCCIQFLILFLVNTKVVLVHVMSAGGAVAIGCGIWERGVFGLSNRWISAGVGIVCFLVRKICCRHGWMGIDSDIGVCCSLIGHHGVLIGVVEYCCRFGGEKRAVILGVEEFVIDVSLHPGWSFDMVNCRVGVLIFLRG